MLKTNICYYIHNKKNINKIKNSTNKPVITEDEDTTIVLQTSSITIFQHEIDLL